VLFIQRGDPHITPQWWKMNGSHTKESRLKRRTLLTFSPKRHNFPCKVSKSTKIAIATPTIGVLASSEPLYHFPNTRASLLQPRGYEAIKLPVATTIPHWFPVASVIPHPLGPRRTGPHPHPSTDPPTPHPLHTLVTGCRWERASTSPACSQRRCGATSTARCCRALTSPTSTRRRSSVVCQEPVVARRRIPNLLHRRRCHPLTTPTSTRRRSPTLF
jgi:hypothetical protein